MKGNKPAISIVTACYNQGRYIGEMLESVYCQTFDNYEVIIVNDGSDDDTRQILEGINNSGVKVIHTARRGPAAARNTAINHSRAQIILNLDADDMIAPDLLEKGWEILSSDPDAGIAYCDADFFGFKGGKFENPDFSIEAMLINNLIPSMSFFRKDDFEDIGGFSDELIYGLEDWDFWLSIIEKERKVVKITDSKAFYRTYENQDASRSGNRKRDRIKADQSLLIIFHRHERLYRQYPAIWRRFSRFEKIARIRKLFYKIFKTLHNN